MTTYSINWGSTKDIKYYTYNEWVKAIIGHCASFHRIDIFINGELIGTADDNGTLWTIGKNKKKINLF